MKSLSWGFSSQFSSNGAASGSFSTPFRETQVSPPDPASPLLTADARVAVGGHALRLVRGQLPLPAAWDASYLETKASGGQMENGRLELMMWYDGDLSWSFALWEGLGGKDRPTWEWLSMCGA